MPKKKKKKMEELRCQLLQSDIASSPITSTQRARGIDYSFGTDPLQVSTNLPCRSFCHPVQSEYKYPQTSEITVYLFCNGYKTMRTDSTIGITTIPILSLLALLIFLTEMFELHRNAKNRQPFQYCKVQPFQLLSNTQFQATEE